MALRAKRKLLTPWFSVALLLGDLRVKHLLFSHIRNTPNRVAAIGAFSAADNASPNTRRVSTGSMTPSSHSRAVA